MLTNWYKKWHGTSHHRLIHWAVLLLFILVLWNLFSKRIEDWINLNQSAIVVQLAKPEAQLALSPQAHTARVGDTFSVDIALDTAGKQVDGVDVYSLHYDPSLLQVIDDVANQAGVQIMPGKIMPINAHNSVSPATGTIKFSQLTQGGTHFTGNGVVATIHFKALSTGTAFLTFDFAQSSTIDTNVAYKGKDQLKRVVDGIYTIQPK